MFIVTVCLRSSPTSPQFMFKTFKGAMEFKNAIHGRRRKAMTEEAVPEDEWFLDFSDDYGHIFDAMIEEIGAVVIKDLEQSNKAAGEIAMAQAHAQAEMQTKAKTDPKLRFFQGAGGFQLPTG